METILNITNGDSAVKIMQEAGVPGVILPWRDVLHDGPVPAGLPLNKLSEVRAQFIVDQGWGDAEAIKSDFCERDKQLESYKDFSKVKLWFEHDLYDQLQILQILDWFADNPPEPTKLSIICTEQYLGLADPEQIKGLLKHEEIVTEKHLNLAKKAWAAFRAPSPEQWQQLLHLDTSLLPFLNDAILRMLEEYPSCNNGLSRTAHKALDIISKGENKPGKIFGRYQETEERRFLGDSSFWVILQQLLDSDPPLLTLPPGKQLTLPTSPDQELTITTAGEEVLAGKCNWLSMFALDLWIGGVQLHSGNRWCWNSDSRVLNRVEE